MGSRKRLFSDVGYAATENYCDLFNLDEWSARNVLEDLAFLRSYGIFEAMEAKNGAIFHFEDHFCRLAEGMKKFIMPVPSQVGSFFHELKIFLGEKTKEVIDSNKLTSALIYIIVTGGHTGDLFHPSTPANIFILAKPFLFPRFRSDNSLKLKTIDWQREFPEVKTTNYLPAEIGSVYAHMLGCDDILYVSKGVVLESSRSNFFMVKTLPNGRTVINTSFAKDKNGAFYVLPGVTRQIVLELGKKMGYLMSESLILAKDLEEAEEAFVTSTSLGVCPVVLVDKKKFSIGPVATSLGAAYGKYRRDYYKSKN